jgi:hypothetical protein
LPVPFASRTIEHFGHFTFIFVSPQRAAFQSRAPPSPYSRSFLI